MDQNNLPDLTQAWNIQNYLTTYIQIADAKAGALIAITALSASLIAILPESLCLIEQIGLLLAGFAVVVGTVFSLIVIKPRTTSAASSGSIFFGHIAVSSDENEYYSKFIQQDSLKEVVIQNYHLARVATIKYKYLSCALNIQICSLPVFWLVVLLTRLF